MPRPGSSRDLPGAAAGHDGFRRSSNEFADCQKPRGIHCPCRRSHAVPAGDGVCAVADLCPDRLPLPWKRPCGWRISTATAGSISPASWAQTAAVMLGNGDGTFQAMVEYPVAGWNQALAAGDFNRDGALDLMVTINDPAVGLSLLTGRGDGTFNAAVNLPNSAGLDSPAIAAVDLDNDSRLDVVIGHQIACYTAPCLVGRSITVMKGNGDGTFQAPREIIVGSGTAAIAVGDFNRDGVKDLGSRERQFAGVHSSRRRRRHVHPADAHADTRAEHRHGQHRYRRRRRQRRHHRRSRRGDLTEREPDRRFWPATATAPSDSPTSSPSPASAFRSTRLSLTTTATGARISR